MITKKSSYLIVLSILLFPIIIIADDCPIIFVHGIEGDAEPDIAWEHTWGNPQSALNKIINSEYGGYKEGITLKCDKNTKLAGLSKRFKKSIYHFSYYNPNGTRGVIGSYGRYEPPPTPPMPDPYDPENEIPENYWRDQYRISANNACWAEHLANFIDTVLNATEGADKVDIVAHSMGGLVARAAITYYGAENKVRKLITVGTPNLGFNQASWIEGLVKQHGGFQGWQKTGELAEMGVNSLPFVEVGNPTSTPKSYAEFLLDNDPQIQTACIAGDYIGSQNPFLDLFKGILEPNDGMVPVSDAHLPYADFNPTIYATHARNWTSWDAAGEVTCTYTTEFVKKWIIDDEVVENASMVDEGSPFYINTYPKPWPDYSSNYCGSMKAHVCVNSYQNVLSMSYFIKEAEGRNPQVITYSDIPLFRLNKGYPGNPVVLKNPGYEDVQKYATYYRINDMNGEVYHQDDEKFFIHSPPDQYYKGNPVYGSFVDVLEPIPGSYIPGNTMESKWVSNENVISRKIYFSGITEDMERFKVEIADLGNRGKGDDWWCEDSYTWTIPVVDVPYGKIKVVENIDNVTFTSNESEYFSIPGDITLQNDTVAISDTKTYQAYNSITSQNFLIQGNGLNGGNVTMAAGETIYLKPGFEAKEGCNFHTYADLSIRWDYEGTISSNVETKSLAITPEFEKTEEDSVEASPETSSEETKEAIPKVFSCAQNRPNPFATNTTIKYGLPKNSHVKLTIFNLAGQAVRTLVDKNEPAGFKQISWDGKNSVGAQVPQGIYFYVFEAGDYAKHGKMVMVK